MVDASNPSKSASSHTGIDRRCAPRVDVHLAATVRGVDATNKPFEVETMLDNFSIGGLYLRLERSVAYGIELCIVVRLSSTSVQRTTPHLTLYGMVVRAEPQLDGTQGVAILLTRQYPAQSSTTLMGTTVLNPAPAIMRDIDVNVSVVIPALNEAENLPHVLPRIPAWVHEVLLVDGHSTDDTVEVARKLRQDIRIVAQQGRGKGAALRTGFAAATGQIIVMLDADGSTDPAEIPAFVGALLAGADFVKGSRFLQGGGTSDMPFYRKLGNWGFVRVVRLLFGGSYSDLCYGYNAFWSHVLPQLDLDGDGFEIETMMNVRALRVGLKVAEVPSFEAERVYGTSNLRTIPDGWRVLKTIVRESLKRHSGHISQQMQTVQLRQNGKAMSHSSNVAGLEQPGDVELERAVGEAQ
jgi:hypothetical protein